MLREQVGMIQHLSSIYRTAPWGNSDQDDFYNQCLCIQTELGPEDLLKRTLQIEESLGRKRDGQKWMARIIDIDILFFNNEVILKEDLKIPHPHIQDRRFVLLPMAELSADLLHPILHKKLSQLLFECTDELKVEKLN